MKYELYEYLYLYLPSTPVLSTVLSTVQVPVDYSVRVDYSHTVFNSVLVLYSVLASTSTQYTSTHHIQYQYEHCTYSVYRYVLVYILYDCTSTCKKPWVLSTGMGRYSTYVRVHVQ